MKKLCKVCKDCDAKTCQCPCHKECKCGNDCDCGKNCCGCNKNQMRGGGGEAVYGLGMIGSAIYFISTASNFWMVILGILKAIVWPTILIYEAFRTLIG